MPCRHLSSLPAASVTLEATRVGPGASSAGSSQLTLRDADSRTVNGLLDTAIADELGSTKRLCRLGGAESRSFIGFCVAVYGIAMACTWVVYSLVWGSPLRATGVWDGAYYLRIAEHGYPLAATTPGSVLAFFPGLPLAIRGTHLLGLSFPAAGFVVSLVAGAVLCSCGALLVRDHFGAEAGRRAALLMTVAPGAFLFGITYADPLALAFASGSLLALDRGHPIVAGVLGACATATSPFTLPLEIAVLGLAWQQRRSTWWTPTLVPLGVTCYMAFLWIHTGSPTIWFSVEHRGWNQGPSLVQPWRDYISPPAYGVGTIEIVSIFLAVAGLVAMWKVHAPLTWWLYTVPILLVGLFDGGSWLDPRLLLNAFPLALAAAVTIRGRWFVALAVCSAALMQLGLVAYTVLPHSIAGPP